MPTCLDDFVLCPFPLYGLGWQEFLELLDACCSSVWVGGFEPFLALFASPSQVCASGGLEQLCCSGHPCTLFHYVHSGHILVTLCPCMSLIPLGPLFHKMLDAYCSTAAVGGCEPFSALCASPTHSGALYGLGQHCCPGRACTILDFHYSPLPLHGLGQPVKGGFEPS